MAGGRRRAAHKLHNHLCLVPVTHSGPMSSSSIPGQRINSDPGLGLLLLNASTKITTEKANMAYITDTWLGPEGGVPLSEMHMARY